MTLTDHWARFRSAKAGPILDWKRFELAATHYDRVMSLTPQRWTHQATDAQTKRLSRRISAGTIRRDLACLRVFATWLVREGLMPSIPMWTVPPAPPPRTRYLTPAEMRSLLAVDAPEWFRVATRLAMASGQRIDAVLGLRWSQVANGILDFAVGAAPRQKRRGVIPILPDVQEMLDGLDRSGEFVVGGARVHYQTYLSVWRRVCESAGVEDATPHSIRHGVATALISAGVPLLEVSRMLGHSSVAITQKVYVKFDPDYTRGAASRMEALLR